MEVSTCAWAETSVLNLGGVVYVKGEEVGELKKENQQRFAVYLLHFLFKVNLCNCDSLVELSCLWQTYGEMLLLQTVCVGRGKGSGFGEIADSGPDHCED